MSKSSFYKALPIYFLLIFFPSLFGLLLYLSVLNIDKNHEIENIKSELSERATDFMKKTTPVDYFQPYFKKLADKLSPFIENTIASNSRFMTNEDVSREIKACEENFKDIKIRFACAIFNSHWKLLNPEDLEDYEQRFFTFAWKTINNNLIGDYPNRSVDQNKIIGREFRIRSMVGKKESCIPTFSVGKTGVLYARIGNKKRNGILIFVEHTNPGLAITDNTITKSMVKDLATTEHPIIFYNVETKEIETSTLGNKEIPFEKTLTNDFHNGFVENDSVWLGFNSDYYKLLFGQKISNYKSYKNRFTISILVFLLVLILSSNIFFRHLPTIKEIYISIRYKLVFLFALAVYMPTLGLWLLSYTGLQDHRAAIENNVKKGMLDISNKIDSDYKKTEDKILEYFLILDDYLKSFKGKKRPPNYYEVEAKLRKIIGKHRLNDIFNWLDIRHINQRQIYTTQDTEGNKRLAKLVRVLSILCLDRYCPERLMKVGIKPSQSDIFIGNVFENPMVGFASIFERPRQLNFSNFDGVGVYWWWNYYPDNDNPIAFCLGTSYLKNTITIYLDSLLNTKYSFENVNLKVITFHYSYQTFYPRNYYYPRFIKIEKDLLNLINISNLNKTIETSIIDYEKKKYLCLCVPGINLKECFTLSMYPISEIDYKIEKIRSTIYKVMIFILIISIFTGLLLAKNFIIPVNELNKGLIALKKRETNTIIKIDNNDELGHLGHSFNKMMSDVKDMLLAGAIQQCLIPTGEYKIEGYECVIYNQMAVDVGGDYADIFELPENKVLIVIGDVTGHGISTALLTAMVKASIYDFANENMNLDEIVTSTSNMICDLLNKKKLMTFCAVTLDKNTGELAICNAGHPYPIIKEKQIGSFRTPCKTSLPMGLSKKRCRYNSEKELLKPGETLFLYTDGYPEAENNKGEEFGYEKFKNLITNNSITNPENLKNELLTIFKEFHGDAELADDITFIILRRKPF